MQKASVVLPLGKSVRYKGWSNAGWKQQGVIVLEDGRKFEMLGQGENIEVSLMGSFVTPTDWPRPEFLAEITVNHSHDSNELWEPSDLEFSKTVTGGASTVTIASEDGAPGFAPDYNDFVIQLVWF